MDDDLGGRVSLRERASEVQSCTPPEESDNRSTVLANRPFGTLSNHLDARRCAFDIGVHGVLHTKKVGLQLLGIVA